MTAGNGNYSNNNDSSNGIGIATVVTANPAAAREGKKIEGGRREKGGDDRRKIGFYANCFEMFTKTVYSVERKKISFFYL